MNVTVSDSKTMRLKTTEYTLETAPNDYYYDTRIKNNAASKKVASSVKKEDTAKIVTKADPSSNLKYQTPKKTGRKIENNCKFLSELKANDFFRCGSS